MQTVRVVAMKASLIQFIEVYGRPQPLQAVNLSLFIHLTSLPCFHAAVTLVGFAAVLLPAPAAAVGGGANLGLWKPQGYYGMEMTSKKVEISYL